MIVRLFLVFVRITGNQIKQRKAVQMVDDRLHISGMEFLENVLDVRSQGGELDETTLADILATHTMLLRVGWAHTPALIGERNAMRRGNVILS